MAGDSLDQVLDALADMVLQHCEHLPGNVITSSAITADAAALRQLARFGRVRIVLDDGRQLHAVWIPKAP